MTTPDLTKSYAGTCPICFNTQVCKGKTKLAMVFHGYTRPGFGYTVGDCVGHGDEPFELTCEPTKAFRTSLLSQNVTMQARLGELRSGRVEKLLVEVVDREETARRRARCDYKTAMKTIEISVGWKNPDEFSDTFATRMEREIKATETLLGQITAVIADLTTRINGWVYAPERLVEHETWVREQARLSKLESQAKRREKDLAKAMKSLATAFRYVGTAINKHKAGYQNCNEYAIFGNYDRFNSQIARIEVGGSIRVTVNVDARGRVVEENVTTVERLIALSLPALTLPKRSK